MVSKRLLVLSLSCWLVAAAAPLPFALPATFERAAGTKTGDCIAQSETLTLHADGTFLERVVNPQGQTHDDSGKWHYDDVRQSVIMANPENVEYLRVVDAKTLQRVDEDGKPWTQTCNNMYIMK